MEFTSVQRAHSLCRLLEDSFFKVLVCLCKYKYYILTYIDRYYDERGNYHTFGNSNAVYNKNKGIMLIYLYFIDEVFIRVNN